MSNGMGQQNGMEPQVDPQVLDVPISVDAFVGRLQQRYSKMVAELMQENAELGAGLAAQREVRAEHADQLAGLQAAMASYQGIIDQQQQRIAELEQVIRDGGQAVGIAE